MNEHGQEVPQWKREQTTLISQIILLCRNANHARTSYKTLTTY